MRSSCQLGRETQIDRPRSGHPFLLPERAGYIKSQIGMFMLAGGEMRGVAFGYVSEVTAVSLAHRASIKIPRFPYLG